MALKRPPQYVVATILIAIGGLANGYDTGSIGALLSMAQFRRDIRALSPSLLGFTVTLIMLTGTVPSVFAGHLADRFGRLRIIMIGAALFGVGALLECTAYGLVQFMVGRAVAGLGEGVYLGNMGVYVCEIAPLRYRGVLASIPQLLVTVGICSGYFTCYGAGTLSSSMAWRLPAVLQCVMAAALVLSCLVLPESPRWLMVAGRPAQARQALLRLNFPMLEAERDFLTSTEALRPSLSPWQGFLLLFRRGYRARTILALFILGMAQLSGIDGVLYYAPTLFSQAGLSSDTASFLASGVSAILMVVITIPAFLLADKWNRRTSAISGGIILSGCMLLIGSLYASGIVHAYGVARWAVVTAVFVFSLAYCATWGIVGKIYASEIQPSHTRAAANSVALALAFFTNWLVAILTPILLDRSAFGAYFLFGGLGVFTVAVLAAYMPETRGRSLENIQDAFHHPTPKLKSVVHLLRPFVRHRRQNTVVESLPVELANMDGKGPAASTSVAPSAMPLRIDVTVS